jgi:hypothetical protein
MVEPTNVPQEAVRRRAIDFIQKNWGSLGDLPKPLIPVVWVTIYLSLKIAVVVEAEGGPRTLLKNTLIGDRRLMPDFQDGIAKIEFLKKIIPIIRSSPSPMEKLANAQLAIDVLKWGIIDAGSMSGLRRTILRQFAKADPEYKKSFPPEISFEPVKPPELTR